MWFAIGAGIGLAVVGVAALFAPAGAWWELRADGGWIAGLVVYTASALPMARALRLPATQQRVCIALRGPMRASLRWLSLLTLGLAAVALFGAGVVNGAGGPILAVLTFGAVALLSVVESPDRSRPKSLTLPADSVDALPRPRVDAPVADAQRARAA